LQIITTHDGFGEEGIAMIRPERSHTRTKTIKKSGPVRPSSAVGTRLALPVMHGIEWEDPMQVQMLERETLITGEEFMRQDGEFRGSFELVEGRLVPLPVTSMSHDIYAMRIAAALHFYGESTAHGVGSLGHLRLARDPDTMRKPDAYFVLMDRLPGYVAPFVFDGAPDLAVEVKSQGKSDAMLIRKAEYYLSCGSRVVWVVHYKKRQTVTVYKPGQPARVLVEPDELEEPDLLPGFRYPLRRLFANLLNKPHG
jgi:Uma2 family endonuclease